MSREQKDLETEMVDSRLLPLLIRCSALASQPTSDPIVRSIHGNGGPCMYHSMYSNIALRHWHHKVSTTVWV